MKKGMFFTIDSIVAASIILAVILFASSFYVKEQPNFYLNYLSQDLTRILSTLTVEEIDNEYINERIASGDIKNLDNTLLEQIVEFWAADTDDGREFANKTVSNVTDLLMSDTIGFGLWIDNETIYQRDMLIEESLVSSKKIVSGIEKGGSWGETRQNPPTLFGPVIVEVRVWR
jgi:hypothetical protein